MVTPRASEIAKVVKYLKSIGETGVSAETPKLGLQYEIGLAKTAPEAVSKKVRTPHWINSDTGEIITSGKPGQAHDEILKEAKGEVLKKFQRTPNIGRISEFPDYVSFEFGTIGEAGVKQFGDPEKVIPMLQGKFSKPIVIPDEKVYGNLAGKVFGVGAIPAAGIAAQDNQEDIYSQVQKASKEDSFYEQVRYAAGREDLNENLPGDVRDEIKMADDSLENSLPKRWKDYKESIKTNLAEEMPYSVPGGLLYTAIGTLSEFDPIESIYDLRKNYLNPKPTIEGEWTIEKQRQAFKEELFANFEALGEMANFIPVAALLTKAGKIAKVFKRTPIPNKVILPEGLHPIMQQSDAINIVKADEIEKIFIEPTGFAETGIEPFKPAPLTRLDQFELTSKDFGMIEPTAYAPTKIIKHSEIKDVKRMITKKNRLDTPENPNPKVREKIQEIESKYPDPFKTKPHPAIQLADEADARLSTLHNADDMVDVPKETFMKGNQRAITEAEKEFTASVNTVLARSGNPYLEEILQRMYQFSDDAEKMATHYAGKLTENILAKLSKKEWINYIDSLLNRYNTTHPNAKFKALATGIKPVNAKVQKAIDETYDRTKNIFDKLQTEGLPIAKDSREFYPLQPLRDFHSEKEVNKLAEFLVKTKQEKDIVSAKTMLAERYAAKNVDRQYAGIEKAREFTARNHQDLVDHGFNTDRNVWQNYFDKASHRLSEVKQWGRNGEKFEYLRKAAALSHPHEARIAEKAYLRLTRREPMNAVAKKWADRAVNYTYMTFGAKIALMQVLSLADVGARFGYVRSLLQIPKTLKSTITAATKLGMTEREFIQDTGTIYTNFVNEVREVMSRTNRLSDKYTRFAGISKMDELTRIHATWTAKSYLDRGLKQIQAGKGEKYWEKALREVFVDIKKLKAKGYKLDRDEYTTIIKRLVDPTIGRTRPFELPIWMSSPYMNTVLLFKKFGTVHTKFLKDQVLKKPSRWLPALAGQYPLGMAVGEIKSKWTGKERPEGLMWHIDNLAIAKFMGILGDFIMMADRGKDMLLRSVMGPVIGNLVDWAAINVQTVHKLTNGDPQPFKQWNNKFIDQWIAPIPHIS